jgi:hypothetical protein
MPRVWGRFSGTGGCFSWYGAISNRGTHALLSGGIGALQQGLNARSAVKRDPKSFSLLRDLGLRWHRHTALAASGGSLEATLAARFEQVFRCQRATLPPRRWRCRDSLGHDPTRRMYLREFLHGSRPSNDFKGAGYTIGTGQLATGEPDAQWKAAAFVRWHEPDDARVPSPDL